MKTLKILALVLAAGFPCLAFAGFAGVQTAIVLNAEGFVVAFAVIVGALTVLGDYARPIRSLTVATNANSQPVASKKSRAYGIRRGADVAKLAA